jgi:hypothetical protein
MPRNPPVRQAIIKDGQVVGWQEIKNPVSKKIDLSSWVKSTEGQEAYKGARLSADADGDFHVSLMATLSRKTGKPYWRQFDPEMYE